MSSPVMLELKIVCSACISMISISGDPYLSISIFLFLNGDTIAFLAHYMPLHIKLNTNCPFYYSLMQNYVNLSAGPEKQTLKENTAFGIEIDLPQTVF